MAGKVPETPRPKKAARRKRRLMLVIDILLFAVALVVLHRVLTSYSMAQITAAFQRIGWPHLIASLALTIVGYAALVGYDFVSVMVVGRTISLERLWAPSFISHAVQNSAPVAIVAGSGVRYKLFRRLGLSPGEIGSVVAANLFTFIVGLLAVAGLSFVLAPVAIPARFHLPIESLRPVGVVFLALVGALVVTAMIRTRPLRFGKRRIDLLGGRHLALQLGVSAADWLLSSTALYALYAASGPVPYLQFLSGFLLVQIVTQVVPLPGGIGVFEAAMLLLLPSGITPPEATAALLLYRVIYYLIPLLAAAALLAHRASDEQATGPTAPAWRTIRRLTPQLLAVLTFLSGVILIFFGAIPASREHAGWLQRSMPVTVVEGSRLLASLIGVALLILAWGLARKVHGAYRITRGLLLLAIPLVLFRSTDIVSAVVLLLMSLLLITGRKEFPRRTPLTSEPLDAAWIIATVLAVAGVIWLGAFARLHREFAATPWWRLTLDDTAPADLRFAVGAFVVIGLFVGARMVARARTWRRKRVGPA